MTGEFIIGSAAEVDAFFKERGLTPKDTTPYLLGLLFLGLYVIVLMRVYEKGRRDAQRKRCETCGLLKN